MTTEHWTDRLSEYLDGELDSAASMALEEHLAACDECATTLAELRQVITAAADLEDRGPSRNLFPGILAQIGEADDATVVPISAAPRAPRRFTFSGPQLAAAAALVMSLTAGAVWFAMRGPEASPTVAVTEPAAPDAATDPAVSPGVDDGAAAQFVTDTRIGYEAAIGRLERELAEQRDRLDPETIEVIESNLEIIDTAIAEARAALENDPSNAYLYRHLDSTMNKKVELLRRAMRRTAL